MQPFGIAIVGAGMAATPHARALKDLKDRVTVTGVYTRIPGNRNAFAAEHGFGAVDDPETLARDPRTQALLLLTPPDARLELIRRFAGHGKHVLCEKPLGRSVAEARAVVEACAKAGVGLGVVFQHRHRPAAQRLAALLAEGRLGRIEAVQAEVPWWRDQSYYDAPGRGTLARDGGGVLITQAIHTLDLMLSLAGPVAEVQGLAATTGLHRLECEDWAGALLRFASGAVGSVVATTAAFPGDAERLRLDGSRGAADLYAGTLTLRWHDGTVERIGSPAESGGSADPMAFPHDWHRDLIAGFIDAVQVGRDPVPSGADALAVQGLIAAILQSSKDGRRVAPET